MPIPTSGIIRGESCPVMISLYPANETERLKALYECHILDTPPEDAYDDVTRLASQVCDTPISTITLIDRDRQWFKSAVGTENRNDPREIAFCSHTILGSEMLIVPDTLQDERFVCNPLVQNEPHIRFYAGVPILTPEGLALGTLCVIDRIARDLTAQQKAILEMLARQVAGRLELQRRVHLQESLVNDLHTSQERLARKAALIDITRDASFVQKPSTNRITFWSRGAETTYGWSREEALGRVAYELLRTEFPGSRADIMAQIEMTGHWEGDLRHTRKDGTQIIVASRWALHATGESYEVLEVNRDVTEQRRLEAAREAYTAQQGRIAETLQKSLLITPSPDSFPGLTVKAVYYGAEQDVLIGGDFFDLYRVAESRVALVIGDATGKGLEAATSTAEIKFALRAILLESKAPAQALTRLNRFITEQERLAPHLLGHSYAALTVAIIDTTTGETDVAVAGMESPLIYKTDHDSQTFGLGGPLLGMDTDTEYQGQQMMLGDNDLLVMTTDGLLEARHPDHRLDFFGIEGLESAVGESMAKHDCLDEVAQSVVARARGFAGGAIHDDVCLLMARRTRNTQENALVG